MKTVFILSFGTSGSPSCWLYRHDFYASLDEAIETGEKLVSEYEDSSYCRDSRCRCTVSGPYTTNEAYRMLEEEARDYSYLGVPIWDSWD